VILWKERSGEIPGWMWERSQFGSQGLCLPPQAKSTSHQSILTVTTAPQSGRRHAQTGHLYLLPLCSCDGCPIEVLRAPCCRGWGAEQGVLQPLWGHTPGFRPAEHTGKEKALVHSPACPGTIPRRAATHRRSSRALWVHQLRHSLREQRWLAGATHAIKIPLEFSVGPQ